MKPQGTQCWNLRNTIRIHNCTPNCCNYDVTEAVIALRIDYPPLCVSVAGGARGRGGQLIPAGGISHQEAKKGVVVERTFYRLLEAGNHPLHAMYRVSSDLETVINFLIVIFEVNRFQDREPPNLLSVSKAAQLLQIYFTLWINCISIRTSLTKLSTSAVSLAWMKLHLKMGGPSLIPRPHTH